MEERPAEASTTRASTSSHSCNGTDICGSRRRYLCSACGVTRSKRSLMEMHLQSHLPEQGASFSILGTDCRRYICRVCGTARSKLALLHKHMLEHASTEETSNDRLSIASFVPYKKIKLLECDQCGYQTKKQSVLHQHRASHSSERPFVCPHSGCLRHYKRLDHLNRHIVCHEAKQFQCPHSGCNMVFSSQPNLRSHLRGHAKSKPRKLKCPEPHCHRTFSFPCRLQSHYETAHAFHFSEIICGEPGCGDHFKDPCALREHFWSVHKDIDCQFCGLSVSRRTYRRHLRVHEAWRVKSRLVCPFKGCKCSFSNSSNLAVHVKVVHMDAKQFKCSHEGCGRMFGYKHTRDNHEKARWHCYVQGDFIEEDEKIQSRPRGGRKPVMLSKVEDLLKRRVTALTTAGVLFGFGSG